MLDGIKQGTGSASSSAVARNFRELVCWQLCYQLKCEVFNFTATGPASKDLKYRDQIRDSSRSAPSNIAEGFGRFKPRDSARYFEIARSSILETQNHLIDGHDSGYLSDNLYFRLMNLSRAALTATTNYMRSKQREADRTRRDPAEHLI